MQALRAHSAASRCCARQASDKSVVVVPTLGRPASGIVGLRGLPVVRATPEQQTPPKAGKDDELPPWVRREKEREMQAQSAGGLPWALYLLFSVLVAIAAVGSIFEFIDGNPIFGVLGKDNPLWAPILLFMGVTGIPSAGYMFIKGVTGFNEEAERQDKLDGYL